MENRFKVKIRKYNFIENDFTEDEPIDLEGALKLFEEYPWPGFTREAIIFTKNN